MIRTKRFTDNFTDLNNFTSGRYRSVGGGSGAFGDEVSPTPTLASGGGLDLSSTNFGDYSWYDSEGACPAGTRSIETFFEFEGLVDADHEVSPTFELVGFLILPNGTGLALKSGMPGDDFFDQSMETILRADPPGTGGPPVLPDQYNVTVALPSGGTPGGWVARYVYDDPPEIAGRLQFVLNSDDTGAQAWTVTPGGSGGDGFAYGVANGPLEGVFAAFANQVGGIDAPGSLTEWGYIITYEDGLPATGDVQAGTATSAAYRIN